MNFSKSAINRPVTTLMFVIATILLGFVSLGNLQLDLMPKMDLPYALAYVTYSGAGPEEMETLITKPLEGSLGTVTDLKQIFSQSSSGMSMVYIEFNEGTDMNNATLQMREKIDMIKSALPDGASTPTVMQMDMNMMPILTYAITGADKYDIVDLNRIVEDKIQSRLERINGVASVSITGGKSKEITVNIYPDRLKGYGITVSQITQLLSAENLNMPVGTIKQGNMDLTVRTIGEFADIEEIRNLPMTTPVGALIHLRDVADISETFEDQTSYSYVNGHRAVGLSIAKQSVANTVTVADALNKEIGIMREEFPDLNIYVSLDQSVFIKGTINSVAQSGIYGSILAIFILYIFLRNVRTTFIVGTSIPISLVATFILMQFSGITLNMISLGGLALGVGMLVDNSIVVLENIFRHREMGKSRKIAALDGAREVAMAVTASTLTTVAVFLPIVYVQGIAAQIFKELALTISFSLVASLAVSLTWVPMLSSKILKIEVVDDKKTKRIDKVIFRGWVSILNKVDSLYKALLTKATKHVIIVSIITIGFFVGTLALVPSVGMEFFGSADQGSISINLTMPRGTLLDETAAAADVVVSKVEHIEEIKDLFLSIGGGNMGLGGSSSDSASINIELVPKAERERSVDEVVEEIRLGVADIAGVEISVASQSSMDTGGSGIDLTVYGEDVEVLSQVANDIKNILSDIEGTREVETSLEVGSPEAAIKINRRKASLFGISAAQVASALNTAVSGTTSTKYKTEGTEINIRVRQDPTNINYITDIENIIIQSPTGAAVPLYEIAEITNQNAPVTIMRENQARTLSVTADVFGRDTNSVATDITQKLNEYVFPVGYSYQFTGSQQQMMESFSSLGYALILSIILVYMVMAAQFESLLYPFIILMSIPIALTGGIFGLIALRIPLSIVGFIGLILLSGIVVNNGIVLIDFVNQLRGRGMELREAIIEAGGTRLRPILMTTLTTVLAMLPMLVSTGDGAEMQRPLAVVVVFGLSISTLVTLIYIPVLYIQMNRMKNFFKKLLRIKSSEELVPAHSVPPVENKEEFVVLTADLDDEIIDADNNDGIDELK